MNNKLSTFAEISALSEEFKIKYNHYICDTCHQITATRDVDPGTTPFFIGCRKCKVKDARATSTFYSCPQIEQRVDFEFFRLQPLKIIDIIVEDDIAFQNRLNLLSVGDREHHNKGGLFMREVDKPLRMKQQDKIKVYFSREDSKILYIVRDAAKDKLYQDCLIVCEVLENNEYKVLNIIESQLPAGVIQTGWSPGKRE